MHMDAIRIASALRISAILVILSDAVGWRALYVVWDDWEVVWTPQLASSFRVAVCCPCCGPLSTSFSLHMDAVRMASTLWFAPDVFIRALHLHLVS